MLLPLGEQEGCVQKSQLCQNHFYTCILPLWPGSKEHLTQNSLSLGYPPTSLLGVSCSELCGLAVAVTSHTRPVGWSCEILECRS